MSFTITFNLDCNISIRQTVNSHAGISIINSRMASNYKSFRTETIKQNPICRYLIKLNKIKNISKHEI